MQILKKIQRAIKAFNKTEINLVHMYSQPTRVNYDAFVGWTFACINERAKSFARKRIYFQRQIDFETSEEFPKEYWLNTLMMNPNDYISWYQLKNLASKWLDLNGNAYFWTPVAKTVPNSIWVLPSDRMTLVYSKSGGVEQYAFNTPSGIKYIPKNEVCHVKTLSPTNRMENNFYLGAPELITAAMNAILSEAEKQRFMQDYLKRDMTDPYVITTPEKLEADEWKRWLVAYNEVMPDTYKAKAVLDEGKRAEMLTKNTTSFNIDLSELIKQITAIFGVPMGLLTGELANRATAEVLENRMEKNTTEPSVILFTEELTRHFKQFDPEIIWTYDEFTSTDPYLELEMKKFRIDYGISTPEQIARESGYVIETQRDMVEERFKKKSTEDIEIVKKEYWIDNYKSMKRHEVRLKNIYKDEFTALMNEVIFNIDLDYVKALLIKRANFSANFNVNTWVKRISKRVNPVYRDLATDIIKQAIRRIGGVITDFEQEIVNAADYTTTKIKDSLNTIQSNLKDAVKTVSTNNPNASKDELKELIIKEIKDKFNRDILKSRIDMIAQTTATATTGRAQIEAYTKRGYVSVWLTRRDDLVRDSHELMDGKEPNEDGFFDVNGDLMRSPATGSDPKENVRCRCTLFPRRAE